MMEISETENIENLTILKEKILQYSKTDILDKPAVTERIPFSQIFQSNGLLTQKLSQTNSLQQSNTYLLAMKTLQIKIKELEDKLEIEQKEKREMSQKFLIIQAEKEKYVQKLESKIQKLKQDNAFNTQLTERRASKNKDQELEETKNILIQVQKEKSQLETLLGNIEPNQPSLLIQQEIENKNLTNQLKIQTTKTQKLQLKYNQLFFEMQDLLSSYEQNTKLFSLDSNALNKENNNKKHLLMQSIITLLKKQNSELQYQLSNNQEKYYSLNNKYINLQFKNNFKEQRAMPHCKTEQQYLTCQPTKSDRNRNSVRDIQQNTINKTNLLSLYLQMNKKLPKQHTPKHLRNQSEHIQSNKIKAESSQQFQLQNNKIKFFNTGFNMNQLKSFNKINFSRDDFITKLKNKLQFDNKNQEIINNSLTPQNK